MVQALIGDGDASDPAPLSADHALGGFDSGVLSLDDWLRRRALHHQASGASRTFVVCDAPSVVAYYALAASAVAPDAAPGRFRRNMPDPMTLMTTVADLKSPLR